MPQTIAANTWTVVSLTSQLSSATSSTSQQSGTGQWQIQVLGENQQTLSLTGALDYQIAAPMQGNLISNAEIKLNGTLQAAKVALALETIDDQYSLQAPSGIVGTLDAELNHAITLIDRNGKRGKSSRKPST